jgi:hypothetical protein
MEPGYTVEDCTDIVTSCTDDLLSSAKRDWDGWAQDCLDLDNCMNFGACYQNIDVCTLYVVEGNADSGEVDDGGANDGGAADDGGADGAGCTEGTQACVDAGTIAACVDGQLMQFDCDDVCVDLGGTQSVGCDYDEDAGAEVCLCV